MESKTKAIVIGLLVRIVLAPFTGHPWDIKIWTDVGYRVLVSHENIYDVGLQKNWFWGYYAYPPAWMIWCALSYLFSVYPYFMILVMKLPMIVTDLFTAQAVYDVILRRTNSEEAARKGFVFYFLNPFVILVGSIWGMFDVIPMFLAFFSMLYLYNGKLRASALLLGLAISFKIYPVFLLPLYVFYMIRKQKVKIRKIVQYLLLCGGVVAALSLPFLILNYQSYLYIVFFHAGHVGHFTYWILFSHLTYAVVEYGFYIFILLFLVTYILILSHMKRWVFDDFEFLNRGMLCVLLAFYLTSTKVNDHYLMWCIPNAIVDILCLKDVLSKKLFSLLIAIDLVYITFYLPVNNFFLIFYSYNIRQSFELTLLTVTVLTALALVFPFVCYKYLRYLFVGGGEVLKVGLRRILFFAGVLGVLFLLLAPIPLNVSVPKTSIAVAVPESPASGFVLNAWDMGVVDFEGKFPSDMVVLSFGPDFVNTYTSYDADAGVEDFFKVRYDEGWCQSDIMRLVSLLHGRGKRVLFGVYLIADYVVNFKGFRSQWLLTRHAEVLERGVIIPFATLNEDLEYGIAGGTKYHVYFTSHLLKIVQDFNFDGVFLQGIGKPNGDYGDGVVDGFVETFAYVSGELHSEGKILMAEDFFGQDCVEIYARMVPYLDYFIVQSHAWVDGVYFLKNGRNVEYYVNYVQLLRGFLSPSEGEKLLFVIETMDEQEGWVVPYVFLQHELNQYISLNLSGFAINHANKCCPFTLKASP